LYFFCIKIIRHFHKAIIIPGEHSFKIFKNRQELIKRNKAGAVLAAFEMSIEFDLACQSNKLGKSFRIVI